MNKFSMFVLCLIGVAGITAACGDGPALPTAPTVTCHGTGASLSSDQEQAKLKAYRDAGLGGVDKTDKNTLESAAFQAWSGC